MKEEKEEKVNIRHTINAEETFTLAKDVYDIRSVIKNVYNNRAVIARRLNLLTMSFSLVFTLIYVAYILGTGLLNNLSLSADIVLYSLLGVYAVLFIVLFILSLCSMKAKAKNIKKFKRVLAYFRLAVRLSSMAITIVALVFAMGGEQYAAKHIAVDILLIVFSIICLIVQVIPLLCGGFGRLARWLLSPVKVKHRFSTVALEWYEQTVTAGSDKSSVKKVSKKYYDLIGVSLDTFIIPAIGKKYISTIKSTQVLGLVTEATEEDRPIVEGILKNIFNYATECGYITFNPCRDLNLEGSIEEEEKQSKSLKSRFMGLGKKIGMSLLDKYIDKSTENND